MTAMSSNIGTSTAGRTSGPNLRIFNSQIYGNEAYFGGGVINVNSNVSLMSSTVAANITSSDGGGVYAGYGAIQSMENSLIGANEAYNGG